MDIDANITGMDFGQDEIAKMISEITKIDLHDNVTFELHAIEPIKEDSEYGGYSISLTTKFFNVRIPLHLDISTGDIITPSAVDYRYETIIAEKLQTVLKRNVLSSRMKDLYDLYFFMKYKKDDLDREVFKHAVENTFSHRDSLNELNALTVILERIRIDETQQKFWENYRHRFSYAKDISLDEIINGISAIKNMIA